MSSIPKSGIREIFDLANAQKGSINLGIGEPDFETPDFIRISAMRSIDKDHHRYTQNAGLTELRVAISNKLKRENRIDADPEKEILVTAGATQAIFVAMHCLLDEGDEALLPTPLFVAYKQSARIAGGNAIEIPMSEEKGYSLDLELLKKKINRRTKLIVLNSPCNPTGAVYHRHVLEDVCSVAEQHDIAVLSDEIYEKFLYEGAKAFSPASLAEFKNRVITINGFSKTFAMTGWRLGYAVANERLINAMTRYNMYNAVCPPFIAQIAGTTALGRSPGFFIRILKKYEKRRKAMMKCLDEMGLKYAPPSGAFYIFPDISRITMNSMSYAKSLLSQRKVAVVPGSSFGEGGEGHIRLSYSVGERELEQAMERISEFNKGFRS